MLGVATSLAVSSSACSKNEEEKIGFQIENEINNLDNNGLYEYLVDYSGLESQNYDFSDNFNSKSFAKVDSEEIHGTSFWNEKSSAYYRQNLVLIWPDCYSLYDITPWLRESNFDLDLKYEQLKLLNGPKFLVIYSSITAKRKLNLIGKDILNSDKLEFLSGDNISSTAIYYEGELVAFKQTGVGSDCENVQKAIVGDVDIALNKISQLGLLKKSEKISLDDLLVYQEELNQENKLQRKK